MVVQYARSFSSTMRDLLLVSLSDACVVYLIMLEFLAQYAHAVCLFNRGPVVLHGRGEYARSFSSP